METAQALTERDFFVASRRVESDFTRQRKRNNFTEGQRRAGGRVFVVLIDARWRHRVHQRGDARPNSQSPATNVLTLFWPFSTEIAALAIGISLEYFSRPNTHTHTHTHRDANAVRLSAVFFSKIFFSFFFFFLPVSLGWVGPVRHKTRRSSYFQCRRYSLDPRCRYRVYNAVSGSVRQRRCHQHLIWISRTGEMK